MKKVMTLLIIVLLLFSCSKPEASYITHVNVVDVVTGDIRENAVIQIEDGLITDILSSNDFSEDKENVFNGQGLYVSPGLSDMNIFMNEKMADIDFWGVHPGDRMLASGITTIRLSRFFKDPGVLIENEEKFRGGITIGPDIITPTVANYTSGKNIENLIREIEYAQADYINMLNVIPENEMNNILQYADKNDIYTCGNIFSYSDFLRCGNMGFDELSKIDKFNILLMDDEFTGTIDWLDENDYWSKYDQYYSGYYELSEEEILKRIEPKLLSLIDVMNRNGIAVTSALFINEISAMKIEQPEKYQEYAEKNYIPDRTDSIYLFTRTVRGAHFRLETIPDYVVFMDKIGKIILTQLKDNDVLLLAGTGFSSDAWNGIAPGEALHDELNIMIECGFTNLEALQTATLNPSLIAEKMGVSRKWGRVEPGYRADLVFTAENPLEDIRVLRNPVNVIKSGILYSPGEMGPSR